MLLRLKVTGFKNLHNVDVAFGPFTCIAGPNAAGKSNLFDAITFLSSLAEKPLLDAALSVRSKDNPGGDLKRLFLRIGQGRMTEIKFDVEMLVPPTAIDELGQEASATSTFLRYQLVLGYREDSERGPRLEIRREVLQHIMQSQFPTHIGFPYSSDWKKSVLLGRRGAPFISTDGRGEDAQIGIHQDGGTSGRKRLVVAERLPRTVLSTANAAETPTALAARREMQSWKLLQLEPSALRSPDNFTSPDRIDERGHHLPATLARLANMRPRRRPSTKVNESVFAQVANRLSELADEVRSISVNADRRRELLSLVMTDHQGTEHEARSLSDGTLRFLALAVLAEDPEFQGVLCLEEPENGIHPERIPSMLRLLSDLAVDPLHAVTADNPLRQVIVNTHSPSVVSGVFDQDLVFVRREHRRISGKDAVLPTLRWLSHTWRSSERPDNTIAPGDLASYFNPVGVTLMLTHSPTKRRVASRQDVQQLLFPLNK